MGSAAALLGLSALLGYPILDLPHIDLEVYIRGGKAVLSGDDAIYNTAPGKLPFTYPPFAALVFALFSALPGRIATLALTGLSLAALYGISYAWIRWTNHFRTYNQAIIATLFACLAITLQPMQRTLDLGQVNILLCWLIAFDITRRFDWRYKGVLVGIATGFKLTPGIFIVWFFLTRQWRAFWTSIASTFATIAIGFVFLPHSSWTYWTDTFFNASRVGGLAYAGNQSINGTLWRMIGPEGNTALWLVAIMTITVISALMAMRLYRRNHHDLSVLAVAFWGLLISPVSWDHHWVWQFPALLTFSFLLWDAYRSATPTGELIARWFHIATWVLVSAWLLASWTDAIWLFPNGDDKEYAVNAFGQLITSAYVVLGCVSLAWLGAFPRGVCKVRAKQEPSIGEEPGAREQAKVPTMEAR